MELTCGIVSNLTGAGRVTLTQRLWRRLLFATIAMIALTSVPTTAQSAAAPELKAAFLLNFVRFTEWPDIAPDDPLLLCVFGDERVFDALNGAARAQRVESHRIQVSQVAGEAPWKKCQLVFVGGFELRGTEAFLNAVRTSPVLTVSDRSRFAQSAGMVELFAEDGRMRFAVNMDSVQRAHLRLSSRLLRLAKIVRNDDLR